MPRSSSFLSRESDLLVRVVDLADLLRLDRI